MAKIARVVDTPKSGSPEDNSNIEPTAAIAAIEHKPKNAPLFGVT
jgi:hypothetical protein